MSHQSQTPLLVGDNSELVAKEYTCVYFTIMSTALIIIVFVVFWFVRNGLSIETYDEFLRPGTTDLIKELQCL